MAGENPAFSEAGYSFPKNLVEIAGKPLAEHVIATVASLRKAGRLCFIIRRDEDDRWHTGDVLRLLTPDAAVIRAQGPTAGAACTALLAAEWIDGDDELLVMNGDIVLEENLSGLIDEFRARGLDAGIPVFQGVHPRWSFVKIDENGFVLEAAEKRPISRNATAGVYWFACGRDFVAAVMRMIKKDAAVDGRFYVCPAFNELVLMGKRIGVSHISRESYFSLATPQGIREYEEHLRAGQAVTERFDAPFPLEHLRKPEEHYAY